MQIREVFNLFDADGGGTIDLQELDFAMSALGLQAKPAYRETDSAAMAAWDAIAADGSVLWGTIAAGRETSGLVRILACVKF